MEKQDFLKKLERYVHSCKGLNKQAAKLYLKMNKSMICFLNDEWNAQHAEYEEKIKHLKSHAEGISKRLEDLEILEENVRSINKQLENICDVPEIRTNMEKLDNTVDMHGVKIARLEKLQGRTESTSSAGHEKKPQRTEKKQDVYGGIDYFEFENYFRGPRTQVKNNQRAYIEYFKDKKKVIDLGCGRGEFLELMRENGIGGYGVDLYPEFVELCTSKGLKAVCEDAVAVLKGEQGIDGIFAAQLIEHMPFYEMVSLTELAYEKLLPGSCLIFETPNPLSLAIYSHSFYMDPSHNKPVHPLTMKYILKKAGFADIHIVFSETSKLGIHIPELVIDHADNLDAFNEAMKIVENTLFGCQDYAVIARK